MATELKGMKLRRGTAALWTSEDPTLEQGEVGYESDTGRVKIGDGATAWTALAYAEDAMDLSTALGTGSVRDLSDGDDVPVDDGTLGVGDLLVVKSLAPLVVEGVDSAAYRADSTPLVCSAANMRTQAGSPTPSNKNGWPIYSMPDGSFTVLGGTVDIPAGWSTVNVYAVLANGGAAGNNFGYRAYTPKQAGDGDTVPSLSLLADSTVAAGTQDVKGYLTITTGLAITGGKPLLVVFGRRGTDGDDTATTALHLYEFRVTKAS